MRTTFSAPRPARLALAAALACSVAVLGTAASRAEPATGTEAVEATRVATAEAGPAKPEQTGSEEAGETRAEPAMRKAAVEPVAPVRPETQAGGGDDDISALPPTGTAPPPSDFRAPEKEEEPAIALPAGPTQPLDATGERLLALLKERRPLLPRLTQKDRDGLLTFYTVADFKPVWVRDGAFTPAGRAVVARLRAAAEDGLDPAAYPVPSLPSGRAATPDETAEAELRLSAATVLYAHDARGGRIDLAAISKLITPTLDLTSADLILGQLAVSGDLAGDRLQAYNPRQPGYLALKRRLSAARGGAAPQTRQPLKLSFAPAPKLGQHDPRVPALRAHFGLPAHGAGTLDAAPGETDAYDRDVADAVAGFQRSRGLPESGLLTRATLIALSIPEAPRTRGGEEADLIANMERWRWLPSDLGGDYVLVNIPEYRLRVYRGGTLRDETRVIVGKNESPTPLFSGGMEYAVVNPSWYVPPSIMKTMRGTGGFEVIGRGKNIGLRQPPGPRNALGYIKFLFPNRHSVYLHDTPARQLFSASQRAFSHGCVRVDDPFRLADAVLPDNWTAESLKKLIGKGERTIHLPQKLPVHLAYFTTYVDDGGTLRTLPDVYGYNARIKQALGLSAQGGLVASLPQEPKRTPAEQNWPSTIHQPAATAARGLQQRPGHAAAPRPRREAMQDPVRRNGGRRYARDGYGGYGEPGLWTPPPPAQPRGWW